jgi:hypothetical protein
MYIQGSQLVSVLLSQEHSVAVQTSSGKHVQYVSPADALAIVKSGRRFAGFGNLSRIRRLKPDNADIGAIMPAVEVALRGGRSGFGRSGRRPNDDPAAGVERVVGNAIRQASRMRE